MLGTLPQARVWTIWRCARGPICSQPSKPPSAATKRQALAKKAYVPDFTVSAGYMIQPSGQNMRNAYMVEGSMNLPWLNHRKHDAEIAEATVQATEQDAELAALRNAAFGQIQEALVEAEAAQKTGAPVSRPTPAPGRSDASVQRDRV